jgi:type II secretory pathway pseudopilin PulG
MIQLNQNRERIKNGTVLHLINGLSVICINDRGYQISVTDPTNKRNLNFIQPSEIQSIASDNNVSSNTTQPESTITNDSITRVNDLSDV